MEQTNNLQKIAINEISPFANCPGCDFLNSDNYITFFSKKKKRFDMNAPGNA